MWDYALTSAITRFSARWPRPKTTMPAKSAVMWKARPGIMAGRLVKPSCCAATAAIMVMIQMMPETMSSPPIIFSAFFMLFSSLLAYGHQEHPQGQGGKGAVEGVAEYGILAPGLFLAAEHARHDRDDSDQLDDTEDYCAQPPPHFVAPPVSLLPPV